MENGFEIADMKRPKRAGYYCKLAEAIQALPEGKGIRLTPGDTDREVFSTRVRSGLFRFIRVSIVSEKDSNSILVCQKR